MHDIQTQAVLGRCTPMRVCGRVARCACARTSRQTRRTAARTALPTCARARCSLQHSAVIPRACHSMRCFLQRPHVLSPGASHVHWFPHSLCNLGSEGHMNHAFRMGMVW